VDFGEDTMDLFHTQTVDLGEKSVDFGEMRMLQNQWSDRVIPRTLVRKLIVDSNIFLIAPSLKSTATAPTKSDNMLAT
jgi:hypothetical protein